MAGLVSPDWLEERLEAPGLALIEVSFYTPDKAAWFEGHIPGSRYVHWKQLCWDDTDRQFPDSDEMSRRLGAMGVDDDTTVVLIGDPIQFATYAYWVLAMTGFEDRTAILDGGHLTWQRQGRPLTDAPPQAPIAARPTPGSPVTVARTGRDDVLAHLGDPGRALVDLRSAEEYAGERVAPITAPFDHGAERGGHIPGALHLPHEHLLADDGTFLGADGIDAAFESVGAGRDREVVTYCRLSHRASLGWFAATRLAGRENVRVYDGSWTEWGSMVGMPVERS